jgi:hypothetical protein
MYAREEDSSLRSSYEELIKLDHFIAWPIDAAVIKQILVSHELF